MVIRVNSRDSREVPFRAFRAFRGLSFVKTKRFCSFTDRKTTVDLERGPGDKGGLVAG